PPPDTAINFSLAPLSLGNASWVGAISLSGEGSPVVATANSQGVRLANGADLAFPGGSAPLGPESILPIDFNYDFKTDLVFAGERGVRFFRQEGPTSFTDETAQTKFPASVLNVSYSGAWAMDVEADGDMDILLASDGLPSVLRNN